MSNDGVSIDVRGSQAIADLARVERGLTDTAPLFREIAKLLERNAKRRFQTKFDPDGRRWPKWAPATAKARAKKGYTPASNLMLLSGALRDSISAKSRKNWAWAESSSPYAKFHEQTEGAGDHRLPRRAFLLSANGEIGAQDKAEIERTSQRYFDDLLNF